MTKNKSTHKTVVIIAGPTASGKSGFALSMAKKYNGVIINADSQQIYDGMPILTAQPDTDMKSTVPHKLYGTLAPDQPCDAALWRDMAIAEINNALDLGKLPILVGGTGFYIKALTEGLSPIPEVPASFREETIALHQDIGTDALFEKLETADPETASRIDKHNGQRVMRAWEVLQATGKPLSDWQDLPKTGVPEGIEFRIFTILPPRETIYGNCNLRFDQMIEEGALDEVKAYRDADWPEETPLSNAIGYHELCDYLDGHITLDDAKAQATQFTRNYAKRQMTWLRNQLPDAKVMSDPRTQPTLDFT